MKNFNEVAEVALAAEQVFVPNRYQKPFTEAFQELTGLEVPAMDGRKMVVQSGDKIYRWARGRNIPKIIEAFARLQPSILTIGLTGSEWCMEYGSKEVHWDKMTEKSLGQLALIAPKGLSINSLRPDEFDGNVSKPLPALTVFPNIVRAIGALGGYIPYTVLELDGGVESVADGLNMAAVDLVSSGQTLRENNFRVLAELMPVYPVLVQPNPKLRPAAVSGRME